MRKSHAADKVAPGVILPSCNATGPGSSDDSELYSRLVLARLCFGPQICGTGPRARHTVERAFVHITHVSGGNLNLHGVSRRFSYIGTDPGRIVSLTNLPETPLSGVLRAHLPRARPNKHNNRSAGLLRCTDP